MNVLARRKGEPLDEAARRVATDALYAARDNGGTMHDAGAAAGDAVSSLYAGAVEDLRWVADGLADINSGRRRNLGITRNCEVRLREVIARLGGR